MLQFKVGDRVRLSPLAPENSGSVGRIVRVREHDAGALRLQECDIDLGTHRQSCLSLHLQHANEPQRLFCGEVLVRWPQLRASEVQKTGGDPSKLMRLLRAVYEYSEKRAQREIDLIIREFSEKIRLAA
jgi:hypothetical protein